MVPLGVLIVGLLVLRGLGLAGVEALDAWQPALRGGLALMFVFTASAHIGFRRPDLVAMVPPRLPRPDLIVTATGLLELAGAVGLLFDATVDYAAVGLALMLVAMFPANVHAARAKLTIGDQPVEPLVPRALIQLVFLTALVLVLI